MPQIPSSQNLTSSKKTPTPQKSNELIPKIAIFKGSRYLFQGPSFWSPPAVSFQGCTQPTSSIHTFPLSAFRKVARMATKVFPWRFFSDNFLPEKKKTPPHKQKYVYTPNSFWYGLFSGATLVSGSVVLFGLRFWLYFAIGYGWLL